MKKWSLPEIKELDIRETALGTANPDNPDGDKYQTVNKKGQIGWEQLFGAAKEKNPS